MIEPKCKNCKWWAVDYHPNVYHIADCDIITRAHPDLSLEAYIDVGADDDQGLDAKLMTHEDFFCAHFAPKKEAPPED